MIIKENDYIVATLYKNDEEIKSVQGGQYTCTDEIIKELTKGIYDDLEDYIININNLSTRCFSNFDGYGSLIDDECNSLRRINNKAKYDELKSKIERGKVILDDEDGVGTHTPSVSEYAMHLIINDEFFLQWLFDDDKQLTMPDLEPEEIEMFQNFLDYCKQLENEASHH